MAKPSTSATMDTATLRAWRDQYGMNYVQLGRYLGVAHTTVMRWQDGERPMPPFLDLALCELGRRLESLGTPE